MRSYPVSASILTLAVYTAVFSAPLTLPVTHAVFVSSGAPATLSPLGGFFGPGLDGALLVGAPIHKAQLQWSCATVPEGEYYVGLLVAAERYLTFSEFYHHQIQLYHNDRRVLWSRHTEPVRPEEAAEKRQYQAELRSDLPIHIGPGDAFRVLNAHDAGAVVVGPLRLYTQRPSDGVQRMEPPDGGKPRSLWLVAQATEMTREGDTITQTCELQNPGTHPRPIHVQARAISYLQEPLLVADETLTLAPGERVTRAFRFPRGDTARVRFTLTASSEGMFPDVRVVRYYVDDLTSGPRPTACLNGEWEMCFVPGVEPGDAPPADAEWVKVKVPGLQPNDRGHCAWYRLTFDAPGHVQGERIVLRCGQILSEAWFHLNGQYVAHQLHGSQPFEVDLTVAFRPGQRNELLIAVRDWLAYSPKNRDRVAAGEAPIYKDGMLDVAGYAAAANLGLGGSVWLEARPAVSVDDVFVVTSVREKRLSLHYRLLNSGGSDQRTTLRATVLDAGNPVLSLPEQTVLVPAGGTATVQVESPWDHPKLWWPEDPHLYVLQTDLQPTTGASDRHFQRFGFRELWIDGIFFVLNGVRTKIRSQWASGASGVFQAAPFTDPARRLEAIYAWQARMVHDADHQLTRTHNQAGVDEVCDVADEVGLMIKLESECNQVNFTFDQRFWEAVLQHELRVMDVYKNHPSVVMWSAGNENMWGWIYQGEAAKVLGNRWQIKIAKAMREFDLMRRPIEWEADGDLMGGWEHHALHYPRELNTFRDLPNGAWWGPLDGQTVVPYCMGPITLGQKPLTVGEAFWPATLNRPFGASIILGDEPYIGAAPYARAWLESSRFFINGFRDAEFALIDTYVPLYFQKPQTLVLKQETRAFYGGQIVRRDVNVHNDIRRAAELALRWRLSGVDPEPQGEMNLRLEPAELKRVALEIPLPPVPAPTAAELRLELWEGDRLIHVETRDWRLFPPLAIQPPAGLSLSVYDPRGDTLAMLGRAGVPCVPLRELEPPVSGALLIGRDALLQPPPGAWREALMAFVRQGGKLVILEQSEAPDFLPVPLTLTRGQRTTIAFARAADHPLLAGLSDADLRWWAPNHYVSANNYRKPSTGNFLPLVDAGTPDGLLETPLIEEYEGTGSILLCQLLLTDAVGVAPQAGIVLQNLLDTLANPQCFRQPRPGGLLAAEDSPLRKALEESRAMVEPLADPGALDPARFGAALVDVASGLTPQAVAPLRAFASAGGRVFLHRASPEQLPLVEQLLGLRIRLFPLSEEPDDIQNHVARKDCIGFLAGISNHELFWASNTYLSILRHEGNWWSAYYNGCPPEERIADFFCAPGQGSPPEARTLTRPGTLLQVPCGHGSILLSQLRLDEPVADTAVTVSRLRSLLLTNLGVAIQGDEGVSRARARRLAQYQFHTIDLAPFANRGLTDMPDQGIIGWTNQGENDARALPAGRQVLGGIPFFIASPRSAVVLRSRQANNLDLPSEVTGIPIGLRADVLYFLHTAAWCSEHPFSYRANYDDGTSVDIPITRGRHVLDWWEDPLPFAESLARFGAFVAWQGDNPMRKNVSLLAYEWVNPHPEKVIRDVDFLTVPENDFGCVPVLVAITAAVSQPHEGVVLDVLGTHGARIRLGTQEEDVYYIGVAGIPYDHPFYAQAVAAHRDMVVGKKVVLVDDVILRAPDGRRLAYVYLGDDIYNINNLVNARIIGDGLGALGNFEGNDRQRMYLENLGFIAKQRKAGMWGEAQ